MYNFHADVLCFPTSSPLWKTFKNFLRPCYVLGIKWLVPSPFAFLALILFKTDLSQKNVWGQIPAKWEKDTVTTFLRLKISIHFLPLRGCSSTTVSSAPSCGRVKLSWGDIHLEWWCRFVCCDPELTSNHLSSVRNKMLAFWLYSDANEISVKWTYERDSYELSNWRTILGT